MSSATQVVVTLAAGPVNDDSHQPSAAAAKQHLETQQSSPAVARRAYEPASAEAPAVPDADNHLEPTTSHIYSTVRD